PPESRFWLPLRAPQPLPAADSTQSSGLPLAPEAGTRDGLIEAIGPADAIRRQFPEEAFDEVIDCTGKCVLPGLVDAHTHPVWDGDRVHEFAMKLAGASYMDIHRAGGGIHYTVEHTRQASDEQLFEALVRRLQAMVRAGTTLVEGKSGYGLDLDTELKMLRVLERARRQGGVGISTTYCGAHAVPRGKTASEAADDIVQKHLPRLQELIRTGEVHVDNIDVFCEEGVFDLDTTRRILQRGKAMGLLINFHGDELRPMGAAEPRLKPPRARKMLDEGVVVALGSDFNPNAHCLSMPMVMHLACVNLGMTMDEALAAATINAAHALGRSHTHGSLEVGKQGDFVVIGASRWEHLIYQFGGHHELIEYVIVKGKVIYRNDSSENKEKTP
ncbi:probable imidazolonepropionase, partial [Carlito syrichta]|uniref:Probable imidazolonepropionase n=1 Tax=Carlito syrichta TaxID=1868482 RepID=A0A3Q0DPZ2_CARSF